MVTDDFPCFFLPRMVAAAGAKLERLGVRLEAVDSNGLLPLRAAKKTFARAFDFRRFLQRELRPHLAAGPRRDPLARVELRPLRSLSRAPHASGGRRRTPACSTAAWASATSTSTTRSARPRTKAARWRGRGSVRDFASERLASYGERNQPEADATSGLSPYLHFGHVSAHQVFERIADQEDWEPDHLSQSTSGKREGWWGMSPPAEGFLDQLVTWRELGYNVCATTGDYDRYESLPAWARETLAEHEDDPRKHVYTLREFETARTHDELWNAAQNQLRMEGRMHNYLRMLWGKKILHWSESPHAALEIMTELNNKHALEPAATRTPTAASSGSSDATTARGDPSGRSSARSAT